MKRNLDLMRELLIYVEEEYKPCETILILGGFCPIPGFDLATVYEHLKLLEEEGFLKCAKVSFGGDGIYQISVGNLTSRGFDFLDYIRENIKWNELKERAANEKIPQTPKAFWSLAEKIASAAGTFVGSTAGAFVKKVNDC